jgi:RNA recognition motif-containing protein
VRCDVPTPGGKSRGYAFVEFAYDEDAARAYERLKYSRIEGREIFLQWAKKNPAPNWKVNGSHESPPRAPPSPPPSKREHYYRRD